MSSTKPARWLSLIHIFSPGKMDTFLYGAAFYEEYMPEDRLDKDVELMHQAGITVVRVGESTWSLWEPEDGHFEFAWMDRIVERLAAAHIRVIMGDVYKRQVDGEADIIVSNDHHLLDLKTYAAIPIVAGVNLRRMLGLK